MKDETTTAAATNAHTGPAPAFPVTGETATGAGVLALLAGVGLMWLRRRLSRDVLEGVKDRAEGALVQQFMSANRQLVDENANLRATMSEIWTLRAQDAARIAQLEEQVSNLMREVQRLAKKAGDSGIMPLR